MSAGPELPELRVVDPERAARARGRIFEADPLSSEYAYAAAGPFLDAVFAAAPYLSHLASRYPETLARVWRDGPTVTSGALLDEVAGMDPHDAEALIPRLRQAKGRAHLVIALADLAGLWSLEEVTGALSDLADACLGAALTSAVIASARRTSAAPAVQDPDGRWGVPGLFVLALGKHGGRELNYSSDIDIVVAFDRDVMRAAGAGDPQSQANLITRSVCKLLQDVTADGYVFRVDLRLRPDPGATPPAVSSIGALTYYEGLGESWERAAYIKARVCAGDREAGRRFLAELSPFVWRRTLDFAAIEDLHAMKRRMHAPDAEFATPGADVKRGRGGIRSIEFFAQIHQLIHGGRRPHLRARATCETLRAISADGLVTPLLAEQLITHYGRLRELEHRIQMRNDAHTHEIPNEWAARDAVAALCGAASVDAFDTEVAAVRRAVAFAYDGLFEDEDIEVETPLADAGSGPTDRADVIDALSASGFADAGAVTQAMRSWRAGRILATRTVRARALLDRIAPTLLEACARSGAPDAAFASFRLFLEALPAGVQPLSLFVAEPNLLTALVRVFAGAPRLARDLAAQPAALDVMLDEDFFAPLDPARAGTRLRHAAQAVRQSGEAEAFEETLNALRRVGREERFRIGALVALGRADAHASGGAYAALADAAIEAAAEAARAEVARKAGAIDADVCVIGLGKLGGRELTAASDLDLMVVYDTPGGDAERQVVSDGARPLDLSVYMTRMTTRMIAALSAPTEEGPFYDVDMALRPSGSAGPIAVRLSAFARYYQSDAWTWELMALTRARAICGSPGLIDRLHAEVARVLNTPRNFEDVAKNVRDMRERIAREKPARGPLDLKLAAGGLVDIEFLAQTLQLAAGDVAVVHAATHDALIAAGARWPQFAPEISAAAKAYTLQSALAQVIALHADEPARAILPQSWEAADAGLRARLAQTASRLFERDGAPPDSVDAETLQQVLADHQARAQAAFEAIVGPLDRETHPGSN